MRLDIKNSGERDNTVEILDKKSINYRYSYPKWLSDKNGKGCVVASNRSPVDFCLKCVREGFLSFKFRSSDVRGANKKRIPLSIIYEKIIITNEQTGEKCFSLSDQKLSSFNTPCVFQLNVKAQDVFHVQIAWLPHFYGEAEMLEIVDKYHMIQ